MTAQLIPFPYKERPFYYILQNDNVTPVYQKQHWEEWMAAHSHELRRVDERDGIFVLTEFVGFDQNLQGNKPVLWKTIVLTENKINPIHGLCWAFSLETDALWFHHYLVMRVTGRRDDLAFLCKELMQLSPTSDFQLYGNSPP